MSNRRQRGNCDEKYKKKDSLVVEYFEEVKESNSDPVPRNLKNLPDVRLGDISTPFS